MFIRYFIEALLSEKSCQMRGFGKNIKRGDGHIGGGGGWGGVKPSAHYDIERLKGGTLEL